MEPIRIGIIGCGVIGSGAHVPAALASPLVECLAVADLIQERRTNAAQRLGISTTYARGEELLCDDRLEAVIFALPTGVRTPLVLEALRLGRHVLIEKPVAMNAGQVREMIALRGDKVAGVCSARNVMYPSVKAAMECVASGVLGQIRVVRSRAITPAGAAPTNPPPPWRVSHGLNGGGILVNWGCYDLDYVMSVAGWGLEPRTVLAQTWPLGEHLAARVDPCSDADNHYISLIRCAGGEMISFERAEFASAATDEAWQILGSHGSLSLWLHGGKGKSLRLDTSDAQAGTTSRVVWEGDDVGVDVTQALHEDFARAIREGGTCQTTLERALVMQQITDAIYASARSGEAVPV
ncbi:MAG: Gfo/Idh/MocA family oxidoreductase [Armatimonadetes bacterium]|nr:Gfo/Idh/MocA family oxidoreductase [Armatimonadota bacterium]